MSQRELVESHEGAEGNVGSDDDGRADGTPIRVTIGDAVLTGRLLDNATARDLIAQLPLALTFSDFNHQEKVARLPRELSMDGAPDGDDAGPADIAYYAPLVTLVIYYRGIDYFPGVVRIGRFDGRVDVIAVQTDEFSATIELAN